MPMELTSEISVEHLPPRPSPVSGKSTPASASSPKSGHAEPALAAANSHKRTCDMSAEEVSQHIETILLERIQEGDDQALFQLGQVYFEQVHVLLGLQLDHRPLNHYKLGSVMHCGMDSMIRLKDFLSCCLYHNACHPLIITIPGPVVRPMTLLLLKFLSSVGRCQDFIF